MNILTVYLQLGDYLSLLILPFWIVVSICFLKIQKHNKEKRFFQSFYCPTVLIEFHKDKIYKVIDVYPHPSLHEGKMVICEVEEIKTRLIENGIALDVVIDFKEVGESFWTSCTTALQPKKGDMLYVTFYKGSIMCLTPDQRNDLEHMYEEITQKKS